MLLCFPVKHIVPFPPPVPVLRPWLHAQAPWWLQGCHEASQHVLSHLASWHAPNFGSRLSCLRKQADLQKLWLFVSNECVPAPHWSFVSEMMPPSFPAIPSASPVLFWQGPGSTDQGKAESTARCCFMFQAGAFAVQGLTSSHQEWEKSLQDPEELRLSRQCRRFTHTAQHGLQLPLGAEAASTCTVPFCQCDGLEVCSRPRQWAHEISYLKWKTQIPANGWGGWVLLSCTCLYREPEVRSAVHKKK